MATPVNTSDTWVFGDTFVRSGELAEVDPLSADVWFGATAHIRVMDNKSGAVILDAPAELDLSGLTADPVTPVRYYYSGDPLPSAVNTSLFYTIKVTFSDGTVLTWPNDGGRNTIKIITG